MHIRLSTFVLFCSGLLAQTGETSEGPFVALAQALSVDDATVLPLATASTLVFNRAELKVTPPSVWSPNPSFPNQPNFAAMPFMLVPGLDVDALSLGLDQIGSSPNGIMQPAGVVGLVYSVTRSTVGAAGTVIAAEAQKPTGAAADLFSYMLPGSFGPSGWSDRPMRSHDDAEIALGSASSPANIDAQDVVLSMFYLDAPHLTAFLPGFPNIKILFSVSDATKAAVPASWWNGATPSGAVVFETQWQSATRTWSQPTRLYGPAAFGLSAADDLDALSVDATRGYALFSTTSPSLDPVLFVNLAAPGTHHVYRGANGVPASQRMGLAAGDDVDALVSLEPVATGPVPMNHMVGTAFPRLLPGLPNRLSNTVSLRLNAANTNEQVVSRMIGWPVAGSTAPGLAFPIVALGTVSGPYQTLDIKVRPDLMGTNPLSIFEGHPEELVLTIPTSPSFSGVPLFFAWGSFDILNNMFDVTPPVGITL